MPPPLGARRCRLAMPRRRCRCMYCLSTGQSLTFYLLLSPLYSHSITHTTHTHRVNPSNFTFANMQLQALHHTHREATRLLLMAVRQGATDAQIASFGYQYYKKPPDNLRPQIQHRRVSVPAWAGQQTRLHLMCGRRVPKRDSENIIDCKKRRFTRFLNRCLLHVINSLLLTAKRDSVLGMCRL
jgi:hypothetical protein